VSATADADVFATEIVSTEVPPGAIKSGLNAFESVTPDALPTFSVACAGAVLVAPCALVTAFAGIVFTETPATDDVTETVIAQLALAGSEAPESATLVAPAAAVTVPLVHVVAAFGAGATFTLAGSVSVTPTAVSAIAVFEVFATVIVRVEVPFTAIAAGAKLFVTASPDALPTLSSADAAAPLVAPCVVTIALAGIVFVQIPAVELATVTVMVHVPFAATLPAASATEADPATAVTVPVPQVVDAFGVAATTTLAGSASVNVMPESAALPAAVFATLIVNVDVPPTGIDAGANTLESVTFGGAVRVVVPVATV
jgi:hypothetical protein